jgi:hypothetical protein
VESRWNVWLTCAPSRYAHSSSRYSASPPETSSDSTPGVRPWTSSGTDQFRYRWDTDGDGQCDESGVAVPVTVPTCGSLTGTLEGADANDDIDTASVSLSAN